MNTFFFLYTRLKREAEEKKREKVRFVFDVGQCLRRSVGGRWRDSGAILFGIDIALFHQMLQLSLQHTHQSLSTSFAQQTTTTIDTSRKSFFFAPF
jgi:hypothetical protein